MSAFILKYQQMIKNPNSIPLLKGATAARLFEKVLSDEFLLFSDFLGNELGSSQRDQLFLKFDQHLREVEKKWLPSTD